MYGNKRGNYSSIGENMEADSDGSEEEYTGPVNRMGYASPMNIEEGETFDVMRDLELPNIDNTGEVNDDTASTSSRSGNTPLHDAVVNGDHRVVLLLIARGADVNARDSYGNTPLHCAAWRGHTCIACLLIARGADVYAKDRWDSTPLHHAVLGRNKEMYDILMSAGASTDTKDIYGHTPKDILAFIQKEKLERLVSLRYGIDMSTDINTKNEYGNTALHLAAKRGDLLVCELLLSCGAEVNALSHCFNTPLHYAVAGGYIGIADLLIKNGANVNAVNGYANTPLGCAIAVKGKMMDKLLRMESRWSRLEEKLNFIGKLNIHTMWYTGINYAKTGCMLPVQKRGYDKKVQQSEGEFYSNNDLFHPKIFLHATSYPLSQEPDMWLEFRRTIVNKCKLSTDGTIKLFGNSIIDFGREYFYINQYKFVDFQKLPDSNELVEPKICDKIPLYPIRKARHSRTSQRKCNSTSSAEIVKEVIHKRPHTESPSSICEVAIEKPLPSFEESFGRFLCSR